MKVNFFPIEFEFDDYEINSVEYSEELFLDLRKKHNSTHSFFRHEERIYISNMEGKDLEIGNWEKVKISKDSAVTSSLIRHLFFRTYLKRFPTHKLIDFYPLRFFSKLEKDDILYEMMPEALRQRIGFRKMIEVQLRQTRIAGILQYGFLINIRRNWVFQVTCERLHNQGFALLGRDVLHSWQWEGLAGVLAPDQEFIGTLQGIDGSNAEVLTNNGIKVLPLNALYLKKSRLNIEDYLTHIISARFASEVMSQVYERSDELFNPDALYHELGKLAKGLFSARNGTVSEPFIFSNNDGFSFSVNSSMLDFANAFALHTPTFIFNQSGTQKDHSSDRGLTTFGPYDKVEFDIKTPRILAICMSDKRGWFSEMLAKLKDGIPDSNYFKTGLLRKYDLREVTFQIVETTNYSIDQYLKAIRSAQTDKRPDLAIIEIPNEFRNMPDNSNPYFQLKAKLLSQEIPVQFVTTGTVLKPNEYILNSLGLQIYAKMGGTPWVLPSSNSVDKELIIGIGHSWLRDNSFSGSKQEKIVGITTFFSSDGQYLYGDKIRDVLYEEYFDELLKSLRGSIDFLSTTQAWQNGSTVRLIFHIFKPIKEVEFQVVSQLIQEYQQFHIQFAFVTISKIHPYRIFDPSQSGIRKHGELIGKFVPIKATTFLIDEATCLVQMIGPVEMKSGRHAMSNPIQVKIRLPQNAENSTDRQLFTDITYIVQQIYNLTYLSWRGFLPSEEPATMRYSNLMSVLISRMRKIPNWDPDSLNYHLKRKKWFL